LPRRPVRQNDLSAIASAKAEMKAGLSGETLVKTEVKRRRIIANDLPAGKAGVKQSAFSLTAVLTK